MSICFAITDAELELTKNMLGLVFSGVAALGALIAAVAAIQGVNAWKKQLRGKSDYQLAEEMLIAAYKYQEILHVSWQVAEHAIYKIESNGWMGLEDDGLPESYFNRWLCEIERGRSEFELVATKCAALWRGKFKAELKWLNHFDHYCSETIRACNRIYDGSGYKPEKEDQASLASANWLVLEKRIKSKDEDVSSYLARLMLPMVSVLDERRLLS